MSLPKPTSKVAIENIHDFGRNGTEFRGVNDHDFDEVGAGLR